MTTLARSHSGDDDINVQFNSVDEKFTRANAATKNDNSYVAVHDVWNDEWYRRHFKNLADSPAGRREEENLERLRSVMDYEIPIVRMVGYTFEAAVESFKRINSHGVRLKPADIENAKVAAKHAGFIRKKVVPFLKVLHGKGYERISVTHLFRTCAFIAHPDGRMRTPLHELNTQEVQKAWKRTEAAVEEALALLLGELGVPDMSILWSASLLVPVAAMCASGPRRNNREIAGWVALAALCHRYSRSSETMLEQDLKACRKDEPLGALLSNLRSNRQSLLATRHDFDKKLADRSALFATFIACHHLGSKDLLNEGKVLAKKKVDKHHLLPRSKFEIGVDRTDADVVANIAFVSAGANKTISDDDPANYLAKIPKAVLQSQAVPLDSSLWSVGRAHEFWIERQDLLANAFNRFVKDAMPNRHLT